MKIASPSMYAAMSARCHRRVKLENERKFSRFYFFFVLFAFCVMFVVYTIWFESGGKKKGVPHYIMLFGRRTRHTAIKPFQMISSVGVTYTLSHNSMCSSSTFDAVFMVMFSYTISSMNIYIKANL